MDRSHNTSLPSSFFCGDDCENWLGDWFDLNIRIKESSAGDLPAAHNCTHVYTYQTREQSLTSLQAQETIQEMHFRPFKFDFSTFVIFTSAMCCRERTSIRSTGQQLTLILARMSPGILVPTVRKADRNILSAACKRMQPTNETLGRENLHTKTKKDTVRRATQTRHQEQTKKAQATNTKRRTAQTEFAVPRGPHRNAQNKNPAAQGAHPEPARRRRLEEQLRARTPHSDRS